MFAHSTLEEEAKLAAMQRVWQSRRTASSALFEEQDEAAELLAMPCLSRSSSANKGSCSVLPANPCTFNDVDTDDCVEFLQERPVTPKTPIKKQSSPEKKTSVTLDASELGDLPARYTICSLHPHQFPVVGVYIDKRVIPGFKYRVRPLPGIGGDSMKHECMFEGRALTLKNIGRGYARRFTFEADKNSLNDNKNYFWSDNRQEGYAFELEVISENDKFTLYDANRVAQGTVEVVKIEGSQVEIGGCVDKNGIEKRAKVKFTGKVEFYETGVAVLMPLSGIAVCVKKKGSPTAEVTKVINVNIKRHRFTLLPGINTTLRRVTVNGEAIGDIPTKYTMTGLQPYEIPVVGTYVDPRIIPGFYYRVRPNDRKEHLFDGRTLKLVSIGMGYAKRLTFEPDSLLHPNNYLWSDNHPDGLGLEPRAVHKGMRFRIVAGDQELGCATVFRADMPQVEEKMEKVLTPSGQYAIVKYIHIDVMCHVKLAFTGGGSEGNEEHLMRVYGLAVVRKEPRSSEAKVVRVENVGLDSQLNLLFAQTHTELTFFPIA